MAGRSSFGNTKYRKRLNLTPGVSANFGKTGVSVSVGKRGCKTTFGKKGVRTTVGIPGTGLSSSTYRPYNSNQNQTYNHSTTMAEMPIRSAKANFAWGMTFLALSIGTVIVSFTIPDIMDIGRWLIAILGGGFFLLGAIIFFTAKSKEDYQEEINELDKKLTNLEETLDEVKESELHQKTTPVTLNHIDKLLKRFYDKLQDYYKANISYIRDRENLRLKEKAYSIWEELRIQMIELDDVVQFMIPRQSKYYNAIKPKESSKPL